MHIISVPTVFTCKTPSAGWVNLAQVRQVMEDTTEPKTVIIVVWHNGDTQVFYSENADAIIAALQQAEQRCKCYPKNEES
ncbi:hypothetical protein NIES2100_21160 [Calothrix sp. NIES-2100]|uniref:hypothetical protein n=1 Tax=Calothrix sp. NIES-2100 TaxID=1954172 RepID=UPI000B60A780|nr:hypothetical protein NIES2100_21160 [Calothrix sp. NIES-2100]